MASETAHLPTRRAPRSVAAVPILAAGLVPAVAAGQGNFEIQQRFERSLKGEGAREGRGFQYAPNAKVSYDISSPWWT
jgi:hypothetical protein